MGAIPWTTDISVRRKRALSLKALQRARGGLWLAVAEESGRVWSFSFKGVVAWKVVMQECAVKLAAAFPEEGALFLVEESPWLEELGGSPLLRQSRHYVIFCYDEMLEVLARNCEVTSSAQ